MFALRARRLALVGMLALTAWIGAAHTPIGWVFHPVRDALAAAATPVDPAAEASRAEQQEADRLAEQRLWAEALVHYDRALALTPDNAWVLYKRGNVRIELEDYDGAIVDYTRAARLEPSWDGPRYDCGRALMQRGDYTAAVAEFSRALALQPDNSKAHAARGWVRARDGDLDAGMVDLNRAIELDARNAWAYLARGVLRLMQNDEVEGCKDLKRCVELNPKLAPIADDFLPKGTI